MLGGYQLIHVWYQKKFYKSPLTNNDFGVAMGGLHLKLRNFKKVKLIFGHPVHRNTESNCSWTMMFFGTWTSIFGPLWPTSKDNWEPLLYIWRIKDDIFCFAHLLWCHNGWTSNILSGGCWRSRYPPRLKYWMPIHYDIIEDREDGQNIKSHLLFSFLVRIYVIFAFHWWDLFVKNIITSFHWLHLNNYTLMKINVSIQETKIIVWRSSRA